MRTLILGTCLTATAWGALPARCEAQDGAFGLGGRYSFVKADVETESKSVRFTGGQLRARVTPRTAVELAVDLRTTTNEAVTERVRTYPLQASLLLFPTRGAFSPFVLGGIGWYSVRVDTLVERKVVRSDTTRRFGSHAGFGAEIRLGRHAGIHADYRYTFLRFGDDDEETATPAAARLFGVGLPGFLPSYDGSMWTAGLTIYF
ncbi:MAG: porin family protein [Acidobacteria bacterium]|nr:porin family protein [Acidobacteriota bacterium]